MNDRVADRIAARNRAREHVERKHAEHVRKERRSALVNRTIFGVGAALIVVTAVLFITAIWGGDPRPAYTAIVTLFVGIVALVFAAVMWFVRQW